MNDFADFQAEAIAFDTFWDLAHAESDADFGWDMDDQREQDGWSERYDYVDEGGEDAQLDTYWEYVAESMAGFWE